MTVGVIDDEPPAFVPTIVSTCCPSGPRSKPEIDHTPEATVAGCAFTVTTVALPEPPERLTSLVLTNDPGRGAVSESTGGGVVVTLTLLLEKFPASSVATAVTVAGVTPVRSMVACQVPSAAIVASRPLTLTVTDVSLSTTVPVTSTCAG